MTLSAIFSPLEPYPSHIPNISPKQQVSLPEKNTYPKATQQTSQQVLFPKKYSYTKEMEENTYKKIQEMDINLLSKVISTRLEEECIKNEKREIVENPYNLSKESSINIHDYVKRFKFMIIKNYFSETEYKTLLIAANILLDTHFAFNEIDQKKDTTNVNFIHKLNVYPLFTTSMILSQKFFSDNSYDNGFVSEISGIKLEKLNALEINFLSDIHYLLYIKPRTYNRYVNLLEKKISQLQNTAEEIESKEAK